MSSWLRAAEGRSGRPTLTTRSPAVFVTLFVCAIYAFANVVLVTADWEFDDIHAYLAAAQRLVDGAPLYVNAADPSDLYLYAPWFAFAWIPFTCLAAAVGGSRVGRCPARRHAGRGAAVPQLMGGHCPGAAAGRPPVSHRRLGQRPAPPGRRADLRRPDAGGSMGDRRCSVPETAHALPAAGPRLAARLAGGGHWAWAWRRSCGCRSCTSACRRTHSVRGLRTCMTPPSSWSSPA